MHYKRAYKHRKQYVEKILKNLYQKAIFCVELYFGSFTAPNFALLAAGEYL